MVHNKHVLLQPENPAVTSPRSTVLRGEIGKTSRGTGSLWGDVSEPRKSHTINVFCEFGWHLLEPGHSSVTFK